MQVQHNHTTKTGVLNAASNFDPVPVERREYEVGVHGSFEIPADCDKLKFLAQGGYAVVARCRVLNSQKYEGHGELAVKKINLLTGSAFDEDWEDNIRTLSTP